MPADAFPQNSSARAVRCNHPWWCQPQPAHACNPSDQGKQRQLLPFNEVGAAVPAWLPAPDWEGAGKQCHVVVVAAGAHSGGAPAVGEDLHGQQRQLLPLAGHHPLEPRLAEGHRGGGAAAAAPQSRRAPSARPASMEYGCPDDGSLTGDEQRQRR